MSMIVPLDVILHFISVVYPLYMHNNIHLSCFIHVILLVKWYIYQSI